MSETEQACIDIFNDFEEVELEGSASSLMTAWCIGKELARSE